MNYRFGEGIEWYMSVWIGVKWCVGPGFGLLWIGCLRFVVFGCCKSRGFILNEGKFNEVRRNGVRSE